MQKRMEPSFFLTITTGAAQGLVEGRMTPVSRRASPEGGVSGGVSVVQRGWTAAATSWGSGDKWSSQWARASEMASRRRRRGGPKYFEPDVATGELQMGGGSATTADLLPPRLDVHLHQDRQSAAQKDVQ